MLASSGSKSRRGRPQKDGIIGLATMVWYSSICRQTGLQKPHDIGRLLTPEKYYQDEDNKVVVDRMWSRYREGTHAPNPATLSLVESRCPGTKHWFEHPLWQVMADRPPDVEALFSIIARARPKLAEQLSVAYYESLTTGKEKDVCFPKTIISIWKQGDLPALTALLALARYAAIRQNHNLYVDTVTIAYHLALLVAQNEPFYSARIIFFQHLWKRFVDYGQRHGKTYAAIFADQMEQSAEFLGRSISLAKHHQLITANPSDVAIFSYNFFCSGIQRYMRFYRDEDVLVEELKHILKSSPLERMRRKRFPLSKVPSWARYPAHSLIEMKFTNLYPRANRSLLRRVK